MYVKASDYGMSLKTSFLDFDLDLKLNFWLGVDLDPN